MTRIAWLAIGFVPLVLILSLGGCADLEYFAANAPTVFGSYGQHANLAYGADRRQTLDVYSPKAGANHPIVVFWYGGSWQSGRKEAYRFVGAALAERGIVAVLPDYRLYPAVRFPEFIGDGAEAVAWVEAHVREYGGDPRRVVLMGHSAGAHMAAMLALNSQYLVQAGVDPKAIVGLVGMSGPYALNPNTDALRTIFSAPFTAAQWRPVQFVTERAPPALLLQGADDKVVSPSHARKLQEALERAHVPVELRMYPGRGHADTVASFALVGRRRTGAFGDALGFVERVAGPL
jgi:acetyl esterase/lipase